MRRVLVALLLPAFAGAQEVVVRDAGPMHVGSIVTNAVAQPHALRAGTDNLVLRRDTVFTTNLLVLGRPTYLASQVQGDVVVVGANLYLRPGSEISGRAIAIGGTVSRTMLGRVGESVESYRDESYAITKSNGRYQLDYVGPKAPDPAPLFQLAGLQGLLLPAYDRVDGLSLPAGVLITLPDRFAEITPSITYRSRLGAWDPGVAVTILPDRPVRLEANIARSTRTNESWIYNDLINSGVSLAVGSDTRNYFRADGGTARLIGHTESATLELEPFIGGRYEKVSPITAVGNVFSFTGRHSIEHMARPNPLVEPGEIGSGLLGANLRYQEGPVRATLEAEGELSFRTPTNTSAFRQLTLDGAIDLTTFAQQRLHVRAHALATSGDSTPRSRSSYIGKGSTVPLLERLEQGGDQLISLESRYVIPVNRIVLPFVGSPTVSLRHIMGAAGVGSLPKLEQELGFGVGISMLHFDYTFDAAGRLPSEFSVGLTLSD